MGIYTGPAPENSYMIKDVYSFDRNMEYSCRDIEDGSHKEVIHCEKCGDYLGVSIRRDGIQYLCRDCRHHRPKSWTLIDRDESGTIAIHFEKNKHIPIELWDDEMLEYYMEHSDESDCSSLDIRSLPPDLPLASPPLVTVNESLLPSLSEFLPHIIFVCIHLCIISIAIGLSVLIVGWSLPFVLYILGGHVFGSVAIRVTQSFISEKSEK